MSTHALLAVGGYSTSGTGRGRGIELLHLHDDGQDLAVERRAAVDLPDPSFVLWSEDGTLLHAVLETDPTRLVTLRVDEDGMRPEVVADLPLDGAGGCHLALGHDGRSLVVAQYGSGSVATVRLDEDGLPSAQIDLDEHRDLVDGIADLSPHPHQVVALPGTGALAVPDLGLDRVMLYRQSIRGEIDLAGEIPLTRGSGPRHLAADHESEQIHIACELSGMVATAVRTAEAPSRAVPAVMPPAPRRWTVRSMTPASGRAADAALSHIELVADESALLVAARGPDTLCLLSLDAMRPECVTEVEVGAHPRHFTQWGDLVLVAAQEGDRIDVLRRSGEHLTPAGEPVPAPSAACLALRPSR
ncbi:beta-propeller fold lactonase family protein [Brachybacterium sp. EE-P12]|uniref:lactonase family protein n=1 Tax=Brachybacterium sp. EE-P12 TaxID=2306299 RepID=UPI000F08FAEB|nr:beta-propeller fold lactonase family protein [Brachybacterium sp. EE-P12]